MFVCPNSNCAEKTTALTKLCIDERRVRMANPVGGDGDGGGGVDNDGDGGGGDGRGEDVAVAAAVAAATDGAGVALLRCATCRTLVAPCDCCSQLILCDGISALDMGVEQASATAATSTCAHCGYPTPLHDKSRRLLGLSSLLHPARVRQIQRAIDEDAYVQLTAKERGVSIERAAIAADAVDDSVRQQDLRALERLRVPLRAAAELAPAHVGVLRALYAQLPRDDAALADDATALVDALDHFIDERPRLVCLRATADDAYGAWQRLVERLRRETTTTRSDTPTDDDEEEEDDEDDQDEEAAAEENGGHNDDAKKKRKKKRKAAAGKRKRAPPPPPSSSSSSSSTATLPSTTIASRLLHHASQRHGAAFRGASRHLLQLLADASTHVTRLHAALFDALEHRRQLVADYRRSSSQRGADMPPPRTPPLAAHVAATTTVNHRVVALRGLIQQWAVAYRSVSACCCT